MVSKHSSPKRVLVKNKNRKSLKTFEELGVREEIRRAIEELGFAQPMPVQEQTIPFLLESQNSDLIALAQTGTGKTAAFGIPLIQSIDTTSRVTQAVVVAPTRELCLQIADDMKDFAKYVKGLHISAVYGGTSIENQRHELKHGAQIVVATPGRLIDLKNRGYAKLENVRKIVLDEADEMLNMGFSESINEIFTMSREVERVAKQYLRDYQEIVVGSRNEGSENVNHIYYLVNAKDKYLALKRVVDYYPRIYAIIFCRTKAETQEVADHLIRDGYNAESLHGDLSQQQRDLTMQKFRNHLTQLLVATDVAARGLDVDDLTHVINYSMPDDIASYTHRSGRTGRAGKKGTSIAIIHTREKHKIRAVEKQIGKEFVDGTLPTPQEICTKQLFRAIDEIEKVDVIEEQIEPFMAEVRRHFEYVDKEDILKKMVSREFGRFLSYYANAPEIEKPVSKKERERGDSRNSRGSRSSREPREPRAVQEGYTRLFINLGKDHGFYPGEVMQFINRHVQGRQEVGHIDLMAGFSFIEVPNRDAKKVMSSLDGTFYKGRQVRCNEDRPDGKPAAGGRGKGRKGDSEGRGRSGRGRKEDADFSRFEKKSKRNSPRKDFDSDVAGMPETGDWRQFFKKNDDQSRRRGKKNAEEPDFSEEGWARRKPKKK